MNRRYGNQGGLGKEWRSEREEMGKKKEEEPVFKPTRPQSGLTIKTSNKAKIPN